MGEALLASDEFVGKLAEAIDKKRKWRIDRVATVVLLALNVGGLLWGAARISVAVQNNTIAISANTSIIRRLTDLVGDLEARMRVVEDRTNRIP